MNTRAEALEKYFQTGIQVLLTGMQVLIIGVLFWFGNKTIDTSDTVIRLEQQMISIKGTIDKATDDRFRSADADAMKSLIDYQVIQLQSRLERLEKRLENGQAQTR